MKTIHRSHIPDDYTYYRTGFKVFFECYQKYTSCVVGFVGNGYEFLKGSWFFFGFTNVTIEKSDIKPTKEILQRAGINKALVFWTPLRITQKPDGWIRLPTWFTKRDIWSSRSAFSILDRADYRNKWSSKARSHRKQVLKNISTGTISINKTASIKDFLEIYQNTKINDPRKRAVYNLTKKLFEETSTSYNVFIAYVENKPLAGAIFINQGVTSEYWASFYSEASKPYHLGIALMDAWYSHCYEHGIKYCDLDHMRDSGQSSGFAGYTKFKESIADYDVYFHDTWMKIFW